MCDDCLARITNGRVDHWRERAEQAEAERDALRLWKDEALRVLDGLQELGRALVLPLGERITGPAAVAAVERLTAERDYHANGRAEDQLLIADLNADRHKKRVALARVRALADANVTQGEFGGLVVVDVDELYAALATDSDEGGDR